MRVPVTGDESQRGGMAQGTSEILYYCVSILHIWVATLLSPGNNPPTVPTILHLDIVDPFM